MFRKIRARKPRAITISSIADLLLVLNNQKDLRSAFTSVLVGLDREYREEFPTMAVTLKDGRYRLIVGDLMDEMAAVPENQEQIGVILCHELMHIVQLHVPQSIDNLRALIEELGEEAALELWRKINPLAVDYADNSICIDTGLFTLQQFNHSAPLREDGFGEYKGVLPSDMGLPFGLSYQEYFDTLRDILEKDQPPADWPGMPGSGKGSQDIDQAKDYLDRMAGGGNPYQHIEDILGEEIENMDLDQLEDLIATAQNASDDIKRQVVKQMKGRGHGGAGIVQMIEKSLEGPKMDWREILAGFIQAAREASEDPISTNMKPSMAMLDLCKKSPYRLSPFPGRKKKPIFKVGVFIDTSASVNEQMLAVFLREIDGILEAGTVLLMIHCDYNISHIEEIEVGGEVAAEVHGRGGTSFDPPFEYVQDEGIDLDLVLYFTDGEAPLPREDNRVNVPVLWVVTPGCVAPGGGWSTRYNDPGETIELEYGHLLVIDA